MASSIDDILDTARNGADTIFGGIKGFRDALATGESRVEKPAPDYKKMAIYAGVGIVAIVALIFVSKRVL